MKMSARIRSKIREKLNAQIKKALAAARPKVAAFAIDTLARIADAKLHATASLYKEGLNHPAAVSLTEKGVRIGLVGKVPQDLERGYSGFDMKRALLSSPNAKTSKAGKRYVDVPFSHKKQGMSEDVRTMVLNAARRESARAQREDRAPRNPLKVTGRLPPEQAHHKTGIHSDMTRTKQGRSASYQTIRRVSSNSDPVAWQHPGFSGVRAIPQALPQIKTVSTRIVIDELRARGIKVK